MLSHCLAEHVFFFLKYLPSVPTSSSYSQLKAVEKLNKGWDEEINKAGANLEAFGESVGLVLHISKTSNYFWQIHHFARTFGFNFKQFCNFPHLIMPTYEIKIR
jgi:hypothetical protein